MNLNNISNITLDTSSSELIKGFQWAKRQALEYVHFDDPVGKWYEAALPNREAFCMRDVCHQCNGAQVLGLAEHNKNMLRKFAENISGNRDYCTYWEINRYDKPAPVDYISDEDFWYNLPANFDMIDCCLRQYLWTGDREYIEDPVFLNFYDRTVNEYVKAWDLNNDGLPEHKGSCHRRGIASYMEGDVGRRELLAGCDLIASMYAGYKAYGEIQRLRGDLEKGEIYTKKSLEIKDRFNKEWWNEEIDNYFTLWYKDGEKIGTTLEKANDSSHLVTSLPLYFHITEKGYKTDMALKTIFEAKGINVETKSHFPEVLYEYEKENEALYFLSELMDENLKRREYPEVSYSVIGAIVTGLMGVKVDCHRQEIETLSRLTEHIEWVGVNNIPVFEGGISVKHINGKETEFINNSMRNLTWKCVFKGEVDEIIVNDEAYAPEKEKRENGEIYSYVKVKVTEGEKINCRLA